MRKSHCASREQRHRHFAMHIRQAGFTLTTAPNAATSDAAATHCHEPFAGRFDNVTAPSPPGDATFTCGYDPRTEPDQLDEIPAGDATFTCGSDPQIGRAHV